MRILFGSWPGYGHLLPLIRAAKLAGDDVVVSSGADMAELIGRLGVTAHRSGVTLAESYARLPHDTTISELPRDQQAGFAARHLFGAGAVDRARDVLLLIETWRPDLVIHEMMELGTPSAAVARGIPHITHGYGPMMPNRDRFLAMIGSTIGAAGFCDPIPETLATPYLDICPRSVRGSEPNPWTAIHPLHPSAGEMQPDATLPVELSTLPHPDTVYFTLGTIMNQAPTVFRAVIDGCARLPVNLIVTTGPGLDPAQLEPLPPAVRTALFIPQSALLPHCRVVVSHAGAGTMLGALCHGLPQLCLPQGTDQPSNTAALLPTGAALALQPDEITADAVAGALDRLLNEPSFKKAANLLREEIDRMPAPAAVLDEIRPNGG
jgi:UDP:flavonoid glycosyltransferase YjiC (YdhE family)